MFSKPYKVYFSVVFYTEIPALSWDEAKKSFHNLDDLQMTKQIMQCMSRDTHCIRPLKTEIWLDPCGNRLYDEDEEIKEE